MQGLLRQIVNGVTHEQDQPIRMAGNALVTFVRKDRSEQLRHRADNRSGMPLLPHQPSDALQAGKGKKVCEGHACSMVHYPQTGTGHLPKAIGALIRKLRSYIGIVWTAE